MLKTKIYWAIDQIIPRDWSEAKDKISSILQKAYVENKKIH
jgi:hypothetical protein